MYMLTVFSVGLIYLVSRSISFIKFIANNVFKSGHFTVYFIKVNKRVKQPEYIKV